MQKKVVVVSAGLSNPSSSSLLGNQISESVISELSKSNLEAIVERFELREYAVDITNNMLSGFASPRLQKVKETVINADILIAISPIFSSSVSGLFKSFIDVLDPKSLKSKVTILAATAGTQRHQLALDYAIKPIFSYLKADVVATSIFAASEDFGGSRISGTLSERTQRAAQEAVFALRLNNNNLPSENIQESQSTTPRISDQARSDDDMTSLPFEQLLANLKK